MATEQEVTTTDYGVHSNANYALAHFDPPVAAATLWQDGGPVAQLVSTKGSEAPARLRCSSRGFRSDSV